MRSAFNFEPKYRDTMLTRGEWTRGTGIPHVLKGLIWFTDWSRMEGTRAGVYGQSMGRRLSISPGRYVSVFQIEIYGILACAYEIQFYVRTEKYVNICSDSQVTLKALQVARSSPLVKEYQKVLEVIYTQKTVELYWVRGNELADKLARDGSVQRFVGPEPSLGVSRQSIRRKIRHWLDSQHWERWRGLDSIQTGWRNNFGP
jgi:hypothetical protein